MYGGWFYNENIRRGFCTRARRRETHREGACDGLPRHRRRRRAAERSDTVIAENGETIDYDLSPALMKALNMMTGEYLETLRDIETVGEYRIKGDWENTRVMTIRFPFLRRR